MSDSGPLSSSGTEEDSGMSDSGSLSSGQTEEDNMNDRPDFDEPSDDFGSFFSPVEISRGVRLVAFVKAVLSKLARCSGTPVSAWDARTAADLPLCNYVWIAVPKEQWPPEIAQYAIVRWSDSEVYRPETSAVIHDVLHVLTYLTFENEWSFRHKLEWLPTFSTFLLCSLVTSCPDSDDTELTSLLDEYCAVLDLDIGPKSRRAQEDLRKRGEDDIPPLPCVCKHSIDRLVESLQSLLEFTDPYFQMRDDDSACAVQSIFVSFDGVWDSVASVAMQWLLRQPASAAYIRPAAALLPVATSLACAALLDRITNLMYESITRPFPRIPLVIELLASAITYQYVHHEGQLCMYVCVYYNI